MVGWSHRHISAVSWPELAAEEVQITDLAEQLRRQINPRFLSEDGRTITSEVFKPRSKMVSTTRDSILSREEAHARYPNKTVGSCFVTVSEIESLGLRAIDDSCADDVPYGHAYIDLRIFGRSAIDKKAKQLKKIAMENGIWRP